MTRDFNEDLDSILRVNQEPCQYMGEKRVHDELTRSPADFFQFTLDTLKTLASGAGTMKLPPKQLFDEADNAGDFRVMPCITRIDGQTVKTVKVIGTNLRQQVIPDQITVGKALVIDPDENHVSHIIEACLLSSARTGICATLGLKLLQPECQHLTLVGCGRVGYYTLLYALSVMPLTHISLYDRDPMRCRAMSALFARTHPAISIEMLETEHFPGDALVLATTSSIPICSPDNSAAKLVISLGADTDKQHELTADWVKEAQLFVDTADTANYGDLKLWRQERLIGDGELTDLFQLLNEQIPRSDKTKRLYVSTGSALFDNIAIAYLLRNVD